MLKYKWKFDNINNKKYLIGIEYKSYNRGNLDNIITETDNFNVFGDLSSTIREIDNNPVFEYTMNNKSKYILFPHCSNPSTSDNTDIRKNYGVIDFNKINLFSIKK